MCGIVGFVSSDLTGEDLFSMIGCIKHRGPDGQKIVRDGDFSLAFNRLGFVGEKNNMQPFETSEWIGAVNGEIYNWRELAVVYGLSMAENSDCRVLLEGFWRFGSNFLKQIDGMFAGIFYNKQDQLLYLFRDGFGQTPLYYCLNQGCFYFASEYKAFASYLKQVKLNTVAITTYLRSYRHLGAEAFIKGLFAVMPGELVCFKIQDQSISRRQWYEKPLPYEGTKPDFREILEATVSSRFKHSPMSFAFSVSGGIDSTLMGYFLAKLSRENCGAYHCSNAQNDPETLRLQKIMSGIACEVLVLSPDAEDIYQSFCDGNLIMDEPNFWFQSHSWTVQKYMPEKVRLCFHGIGPDEFFLGYDIFDVLYGIKDFAAWRSYVTKQIFFLEAVQGLFTEEVAGKSVAATEILDELLNSLGITVDPFNADESCRLFLELSRFISFSQICSFVNKFGMNFGREARYPFLSNELYRYGLSSSFAELRNNQQGKIPLRIISEEVFGAKFAQAPKMGQSYSDQLFYNEQNYQRMRDLFLQSRMVEVGLLKKDATTDLFEQIKSGKRRDLLLFGLCSMEHWLQSVLEKTYGITNYSLE